MNQETVNVNNIDELSNIINHNIIEFRKIVHKLDHRYKNGKIVIENIKKDINYLNQYDEKSKNDILSINKRILELEIQLDKEKKFLYNEINEINGNIKENDIQLQKINDELNSIKTNIKNGFIFLNIIVGISVYIYYK